MAQGTPVEDGVEYEEEDKGDSRRNRFSGRRSLPHAISRGVVSSLDHLTRRELAENIVEMSV